VKAIIVSLVVSSAALAAGAVVSAEALPADFVKLAKREIALAKKTNPEMFEAVAATRSQMGRLDARKRGRFAPVTTQLASLGPQATWALVDALVFDGAIDASLPRSAHVAWQGGLLEALGRTQDARVEPLLTAALRRADLEPEVVRSATEGLGLLGTDSALATLTALASTPGARREAMLAGLGACRRLGMAEFLARALAAATTDTERLALVKALSQVGNAWALSTPTGAPAPAEVPKLRAVAAGALVKLYARSRDTVRKQAGDAILIVAAPETPELLAQVRALDPAAVDGLSQRFLAQPR
jgi:hypothetical protein